MHEPADLADPLRHLDSIWRTLAEATHDVSSPLRTPTLATVGLDGSAQARTVVLRSVDDASRQFVIYTDARSPKVAELAREPRATLSFWDAEEQVQLRAMCECVRVRDAATLAEAWKGVPESNRLNYRTTMTPGAKIDAPAAGTHEGDGFANFAVLELHVRDIDWLWLDRRGHRRCRFDLSSTGATRQWLVP